MDPVTTFRTSLSFLRSSSSKSKKNKGKGRAPAVEADDQPQHRPNIYLAHNPTQAGTRKGTLIRAATARSSGAHRVRFSLVSQAGGRSLLSSLPSSTESLSSAGDGSDQLSFTSTESDTSDDLIFARISDFFAAKREESRQRLDQLEMVPNATPGVYDFYAQGGVDVNNHSASAPSLLSPFVMSVPTGSSTTFTRDGPTEKGEDSDTLSDVFTSRPWNSPYSNMAVSDEYKEALTSAMRVLTAVMMHCANPLTLSEVIQLGFLINDLYNETANQPTTPSSEQKIDEFIALVNGLLGLVESFVPSTTIPPGPVPSTSTIPATGRASSIYTFSTTSTTLDTLNDPQFFAEIEGSLVAALEKLRKGMDKMDIYYADSPAHTFTKGWVGANIDEARRRLVSYQQTTCERIAIPHYHSYSTIRLSTYEAE